MKLPLVQSTGSTSTLNASDAVFAAPVNKILVSQVVRVYRANARQGTSKVKSRGEVSLTKRKMYKQKGTGNARHAAQSAPIFVGGGVAHGPTGLQNWSLTASKAQKQGALISALSWQAPQIMVAELEATKTGAMAAVLKTVAPDAQTVLVVLPRTAQAQERALRNLPFVTVRSADRLNTLDVAMAHKIIFTEAGLRQLEERLSAPEAESTEEVTVVAEKKVAKKAAPKKTTKKTEKK